MWLNVCQDCLVRALGCESLSPKDVNCFVRTLGLEFSYGIRFVDPRRQVWCGVVPFFNKITVY